MFDQIKSIATTVWRFLCRHHRIVIGGIAAVAVRAIPLPVLLPAALHTNIYKCLAGIASITAFIFIDGGSPSKKDLQDLTIVMGTALVILSMIGYGVPVALINLTVGIIGLTVTVNKMCKNWQSLKAGLSPITA